MKCGMCKSFILVDEFFLQDYKVFPDQPDTATYSATGECMCGKVNVSIHVVYPQKKN